MEQLRLGWVVLPLLSLVLLACGGDAPGDVGGGAPPRAACTPGELTLADGRCQPAGLPLDMACPPGERALPTSGGVGSARCQPAGVPAEACAAERFVPDGRSGCAPILPEAACPFSQMAVPGESACREVAPCGDGPWDATIPDEATTEHVDQGYPGSDSDGSREKPWKTVSDGVQAASPGAIVAVAAGRYVEDVLVSGKPVRLWGLCPARTEVVGMNSQSAAITLLGERSSASEVRRLAVTGPGGGIFMRDARSVVLEGVWVHEAGAFGVVTVRADVTVRGALVEKNRAVGVGVEGSEVAVEATVVRATQLNGAGRGGWGIAVQPNPSTGEGGKLSLTASLIEQNHDTGVMVEGSEATVEATIVRATQPDRAGYFGRGIVVQPDPSTGQRGKLSLTASLIEQIHEIGVIVIGSEAMVEATIVRATQPDRAGYFGRGIVVQPDPSTGQRGKLSLTASLIEQNHDAGVIVIGSEAMIEATIVRATQPNDAGHFGRGIAVQPDDMSTGERGTLSLTASLIEQNHDVGVIVIGSEAMIEATIVRATQPNDAGHFGLGIAVQPDPSTGERGTLSLTASLIEQNHEMGVIVFGSEAAVEATVVRATQPDGAGHFGRGISVQPDLSTGERGKLSLTASLVEQNHDVGVCVIASEVTIEATAVRATKQAPAGLEFGDGILVLDELGQSSVTVSTTESTDNARAGLFFQNSTGHISLVRSAGNHFGLVRTGDAKPTLDDANVFEDNQQNRVEGGDLAVPDAAPPHP